MPDPVQEVMTTPNGKRSRGQVLALACLSLLLLALMTMLSFNLATAIHAKTRLQQNADVLAYSMATVEARALNYFAYSNRAQAGSFVTQTSLHAYMAAASTAPSMMFAARKQFLIIGGLEVLACIACCPKCCISHCKHAIKAFKVANKFKKEGNKLQGKVNSLDKTFKLAVTAMNLHSNLIHTSQQAMLLETGQMLQSGQPLDTMKEPNALGASKLPAMVGALNLNELNCAIDTTLPCTKGGGTTRIGRAKIMTDVVNASRPDWPAKRDGFPLHMSPKVLMDVMMKIQGKGFTILFSHKGTAKITSSTAYKMQESTLQNQNGTTCGAEEHGYVYTPIFEDIPSVAPTSYRGEVYSNSKGGRHFIQGGKTHQGHKQFDGVNQKDLCILTGNCFVNFRANDKKKDDYNMPSVFAFQTLDLARTFQGTKGPWTLNAQGSFTFDHGGQGTGKLQLTPDEGVAVSKAKVYYHRLGNWREQPNMFNPYWRAKLHPLNATDAALTLGAAGYTDGVLLAPTGTVN